MTKKKKKRKKKEKQEEKTHSTKVKLTQKLTEIGGLWTCNEQFASFKDSHSEKAYREALISQFNSIQFNSILKSVFGKSVLGSKESKALFQQQIKGKLYTTPELEENLKQIIVLNTDAETETEEPQLKYRSITEAQEKVSVLNHS